MVIVRPVNRRCAMTSGHAPLMRMDLALTSPKDLVNPNSANATQDIGIACKSATLALYLTRQLTCATGLSMSLDVEKDALDSILFSKSHEID